MLVYSNNGESFMAVADDYQAQEGEVLFSDYATPVQLGLAFQGYVMPLTDEQESRKFDAQQALKVTDSVFIRCGKAGVAWPDEWKDYVIALRAVVSDPVGNTVLPSRPDYPEGS